MENKNPDPADKQDVKQAINTDKKEGNDQKGQDKKEDFKVLHKDGSLADLPYNNEPGGNALEGTVGIGT